MNYYCYSDRRREIYGGDNFFRQSHRLTGSRTSAPPPYVGPTHGSQYFPPSLLSGYFHYLQAYWATLLDHFSLLYNEGFRCHSNFYNHPTNIYRNSSTRSRFRGSDHRKKRRLPYSRHQLRTRASDSIVIRRRSNSRGILTVRKAHPRTIRSSNFHKQMESPNYMPPTNFGNSTHTQSPLQVSVGRNRDKDTCFKCNEKGHWAVNCPGKTPEKSRVLPVPVVEGDDGFQYSAPYLICWCGLLCDLIISNSENNPNRKYYLCKHRDGTKTFKWEDEVKKEELLSIPKCTCGAGFCRIYTELSWTEAALKYFVCPIRKNLTRISVVSTRVRQPKLKSRSNKGQGACTFKKLLNGEVLTGDEQGGERISPLQSTLGDYSNICPVNSVGDGICGHKRKGLEIGSISGQLQRVEPVGMESESEDGTSDELLRKCNNKLTHRSLEYSSFDSVVKDKNPGSFSRGRAQSLNTDEIRIRQVEFLKQISSSGVFPPHDPISVPQIEDRLDRQPDLRSLQGPPEGSLMICAISNGIAKLASELGNKLICVLESTDFHKHGIMEREASITFTALDQLQICSESFREGVKELIRCASLLDEIEGFICNVQTYNHLQEQCKRKKRKRDDFSHDYAVVKSDLEATKERHRTLSEGPSRARNLQVEVGLSCSVLETRYYETRCTQISKDLDESEQELKVALQAAEEASKLLQQKKEEYNVAEAAYKKARVELRRII